MHAPFSHLTSKPQKNVSPDGSESYVDVDANESSTSSNSVNYSYSSKNASSRQGESGIAKDLLLSISSKCDTNTLAIQRLSDRVDKLVTTIDTMNVVLNKLLSTVESSKGYTRSGPRLLSSITSSSESHTVPSIHEASDKDTNSTNDSLSRSSSISHAIPTVADALKMLTLKDDVSTNQSTSQLTSVSTKANPTNAGYSVNNVPSSSTLVIQRNDGALARQLTMSQPGYIRPYQSFPQQQLIMASTNGMYNMANLVQNQPQQRKKLAQDNFYGYAYVILAIGEHIKIQLRNKYNYTGDEVLFDSATTLKTVISAIWKTEKGSNIPRILDKDTLLNMIINRDSKQIMPLSPANFYAVWSGLAEKDIADAVLILISYISKMPEVLPPPLCHVIQYLKDPLVGQNTQTKEYVWYMDPACDLSKIPSSRTEKGMSFKKLQIHSIKAFVAQRLKGYSFEESVGAAISDEVERTTAKAYKIKYEAFPTL